MYFGHTSNKSTLLEFHPPPTASSPISLILWKSTSWHRSRPWFSRSPDTILAQILITSCLDYCNRLLICLLVSTFFQPLIHSPHCHQAQGLTFPNIPLPTCAGSQRFLLPSEWSLDQQSGAQGPTGCSRHVQTSLPSLLKAPARWRCSLSPPSKPDPLCSLVYMTILHPGHP